MNTQIANITIPDNIDFSMLKLQRESNGDVSFDWSVIEGICAASQLPVALFRDAPEDNVCRLIVSWYESHRQNGGDADPVAEDLIFELQAENNAGQFVSYQPGRV